MSKLDYVQSADLFMQGYSFEALIMTAVRVACTTELHRCSTIAAFYPEIYQEYQERSADPDHMTVDERNKNKK